MSIINSNPVLMSTDYKKDNINPCPFCGKDGSWLEVRKNDNVNEFFVECSFCNGKSGVCDDLELAITKWNKRTFISLKCEKCDKVHPFPYCPHPLPELVYNPPTSTGTNFISISRGDTVICCGEKHSVIDGKSYCPNCETLFVRNKT